MVGCVINFVESFLLRHYPVDLMFASLQKVEHVGEGWLKNCGSLRDVAFVGMISLQSVGVSWLADCPGLRIVDLRGLGALKTVGKDRMSTQEINALSTFQPHWGSRLQAFQTGGKRFSDEFGIVHEMNE
jgi:hypothetical protein